MVYTYIKPINFVGTVRYRGESMKRNRISRVPDEKFYSFAITCIAKEKREGFVVEFWVCFEHSTHTMFTPTPRIFVSEFFVCCRVLGLLSNFGFI